MLAFSPCKINIGLDIVAKRPDGYHDIVTAMVPVPWHDIIEIIPDDSTSLTVLGRAVDCPPEKNLVMKAYRAMESRYSLPPVHIILQKIIPDGAGLGGGSADAATVILMLNTMFELNLTKEEMAQIASTIGADCPFFIYQRSMLCTGTGTLMTPIDLDLDGMYVLISKPDVVSVSTKEAYAAVTPQKPQRPLAENLLLPVTQWQGVVKNDFEPGIMERLPQVRKIRDIIQSQGAVYASMSGSGSSVFGLFYDSVSAKRAAELLTDTTTFLTKLSLR